MRTVGTPWARRARPAMAPGPSVRMAQLAHVHRFDLVLTPAEQIAPGRVDAEKVAIEIANAEQVFGHFPDPIPFACALFHLGLEPIGEGLQNFLVTHALGSFKGGGENTTDPVRTRQVPGSGYGLLGARSAARPRERRDDGSTTGDLRQRIWRVHRAGWRYSAAQARCRFPGQISRSGFPSACGCRSPSKAA